MKEQKKEKIVVLIVLLFILGYLIIWDYDKLIREPREAREKSAENELNNFEAGHWCLTWESSPATAISTEELEALNSDSNELILESDITGGEILILPEEGAEHEGQILTVTDSNKGIFIWDSRIYKLAWIWQGLNPNASNWMNEETYQRVTIADEFIKWLYNNDYEIVKKEGK